MNTDSEMTLNERRDQNVTILEVIGSINSANARQFGDHMTSLIENGCKQLVVDLNKLEYMTSAGFRSLLIAGKSASRTKSEYVLCSLSNDVERLFELGGFLDLFPIFENSAEAIESMTK